MITSEMVSILSVGLPALGAVLSAVVSFVGVLPGAERRLHRLVAIHRDMPEGEGKDALEDALNQLAVRTARRAVSGREERQRERRKVDAGGVIGVVIVVLIGGGAAWGLWLLGTLPVWPVLRWTLWVLAILLTLVTTFFVSGMPILKEEDGTRKDRSATGTKKEAEEPAPEDAPVPAPADGV
ncbi:hypothetical protein [Promicromonospora sp. NPDC057488]|uniref:hypothetical protein n=1 Tax=Promicromonospora sp. NPDC057488 TaxID=3346147 RepID=UPI00366E6B12